VETQETFDRNLPDRLQERLHPADIRLQNGAASRMLIDMRLGGKVHHGQIRDSPHKLWSPISHETKKRRHPRFFQIAGKSTCRG
jgi:hypothetical protein